MSSNSHTRTPRLTRSASGGDLCGRHFEGRAQNGHSGRVLPVTTGPEVIRSGAIAVTFAAVGLLWVHYGLPRFSRASRFPVWHDNRWAKTWNYGVLLMVGIAGVVAVLVGVVASATGHHL